MNKLIDKLKTRRKKEKNYHVILLRTKVN